MYAHNVGNVTALAKGATAPFASVQVGPVMIYVHGSDEYDALPEDRGAGRGDRPGLKHEAVRLAAKVEVVA